MEKPRANENESENMKLNKKFWTKPPQFDSKKIKTHFNLSFNTSTRTQIIAFLVAL